MFDPDISFDLLFNIAGKLYWVPFVVLLVIAFLLFRQAWLYMRQSSFKAALEYSVLQIKIPREIEKGPKAMEQFFYNLTNLMNPKTNDFFDVYKEGEVPVVFSFEIVGANQTTLLYMRIHKGAKLQIISLLYGMYNDLEIVEVEDYIFRMPNSYHKLRDAGYDIWGTEIHLRKESAYPLRTYIDFEDKAGEERIVDPMGTLVEMMSSLQRDEQIWIQFLLTNAGSDWKKEGQKIVDEIKNKSQRIPGDKEKPFTFRTPGEELLLKGIEEKVSKPGFRTIIRMLYLAPKAIFGKEIAEHGIFSTINQISSGSNEFKKNSDIKPSAKWYKYPFIFPSQRIDTRKQLVYKEYRNRFFEESTWVGKIDSSSLFRWNFKHRYSVLSTAEMATIYHPPTNVVLTSATMERIESKRIAPPANLPM